MSLYGTTRLYSYPCASCDALVEYMAHEERPVENRLDCAKCIYEYANKDYVPKYLEACGIKVVGGASPSRYGSNKKK